ncbi:MULTISPECIES: ABC transporter permease subunit [Exiguobacterium]|uniref:ABC transporter permease subunit n=1 Tax=Exiguobacterium TaxID=33986 RepID=UPI00047A6992|nr:MULTISPECIES: ABC transporter permease subunit [Exiguobacterium]MCT4779765.1 ABC transporter permease subunit [Exiguobacterium soli]
MKPIFVKGLVGLVVLLPLIGLLPSTSAFNPRLLDTLTTTITMIVAATFLNHLIGYGAGKAIAFKTGRTTRLMELLISLPLFLPVLLLSFGLYLTWIRLGLADQFLGVLLVLLLPTLPYTIRIYTNGFQTLGEQMMEQMVLIEPNRFKRFFFLTGPMMRSSLQSVTLLVTVIALSQYALVTLIGGGVVRMIALEAFPLYSGNSLAAAKEATLWLIALPFLIYFVQLILFFIWVQLVRRLLDGRYDPARK